MSGSWLQDVRYAVRMMRRFRSLTVLAVLTLAIAVGANTAIFSVVNAVLLRPLPYPDADRLTLIWENVQRPTGVERRTVSFPDFLDWQRSARTFDAVAATSSDSFTLSSAGAPERVSGELVSAKYFDVLRAAPALGRTFNELDDAGANGDVAVLSDSLWKNRFGGRSNVVGEIVRINDRPTTIVGVMPSRFLGVTDTSEIWLPITRFTSQGVLQNRGSRWHAVVGRLRATASLEQAQADLSAIAAQLARDLPDTNRDRGIEVAHLRDEIVGALARALWVLFGAVGCVLLIACANIANLLLSRASARHREMAVRMALGARRGRLVRQLLTESVLLGLAGGALGALLASWSVDALVSLNPVELPRYATVAVDPLVLSVAALLSIATGLVFGVAPALALSAPALYDSVKQSGHTSLNDPRGDRTRRLLVVAEVALSLVLLIGASLLLRTLHELTTIDPGFQPRGLLTLRVDLPASRYDTAKTRVFAISALERLSSISGVTRASLASDVPLGGVSNANFVALEGRIDREKSRVRAFVHRVSPGFFAALGAPVVRGRDFTSDDTDRGQREGVAIVSLRLARRYWADAAVEKRIMIGETPYQVVGVVADVQHRSLTEPGTADPDVYLAFAQVPSTGFAFVLRADEQQTDLPSRVRTAIQQLDASVPIFRVAWGTELFETQTASSRFSAVLLTVFAATALLLSLVGIYGVVSFLVSREARHIGIRMALGASARDIVRLILRRAAAPIAIGLVVGLVSAFALTRLIASLLYGVSSTDPLTFVATPAILAAVAIIASYGPARRATRVNPVVALRAE